MANRAITLEEWESAEATGDYTKLPEGSVLGFDPEPVHGWFELTYASYLVLPRSILQAMPVRWQQKFVECLKELEATFDYLDANSSYEVTLQKLVDQKTSRSGHITNVYEKLDDPLGNYRHPPDLERYRMQ